MAQMEIFHAGAEPAAEAPVTEAEAKPLTKAILRVLEKAKAAGVVRRAGISGDTPQEVSADDAAFDWQLVIDRAIAMGLLKPGEYFNTYELTAAGKWALVDAAEAEEAAAVQPRKRRRKVEGAAHV